MAFTNKGGTSGDITNVTSSSDTVASVAVPDLGANRVGVVHVITNHLNPVTGVTWGGVAMTEQWDPRQINDTGNNRISAYYLVGCGHNTTLDVVLTYGGSQIHSTHVAIIWASAGGTITIDDFDEEVGTATASPDIISTQTAANELVVSCSANEAASIAGTPVTDCTLHSSRDFGAWCAIVAYSIPATSGAVTHIHNYQQSDTYVIQSMSFQEAAGDATLAAGTQTVTFSAPTAVATGGAVSIAAGAQTVTLTAPTAAAAPGGIALPAGAQEVVVTAPTAVLSPGGATVAAGVQTIIFSVADAVVLGGPVSVTAGVQEILLTAPTATLSTGGDILEAGVQTITLTSPTAVVVPGGTTITAGTQTITVIAPTAVLLLEGGEVVLYTLPQWQIIYLR